MITGKAEQDFFARVRKDEFLKKSKKHQYNKYISFFAENGIPLTLRKAKLGGCVLYFSNEYDICGWNLIDYQEKVIEEACKTYNNSH